MELKFSKNLDNGSGARNPETTRRIPGTPEILKKSQGGADHLREPPGAQEDQEREHLNQGG